MSDSSSSGLIFVSRKTGVKELKNGIKELISRLSYYGIRFRMLLCDRLSIIRKERELNRSNRDRC